MCLSSQCVLLSTFIVFSRLSATNELCEYLQEWFSQRIESLATSLSSGHVAYIIPSTDSSAMNVPSYLMSEIPSDSTITTLRSLARHYVDISELCILALHVEVRMHCFHHLLAIAHGPHTDYHGIIDKMEPDENVTRLNKDLTAIDDVMQQTLQQRKFRFAVSILSAGADRQPLFSVILSRSI